MIITGQKLLPSIKNLNNVRQREVPFKSMIASEHPSCQASRMDMEATHEEAATAIPTEPY
jgi:hypothetical protein